MVLQGMEGGLNKTVCQTAVLTQLTLLTKQIDSAVWPAHL